MEEISDDQFDELLNKYKQFIDAFLQFKDYIAISNFRRNIPVAPPFLAELLARSSQQEQETLLKALQESYETGMSYALAVLDGYRIADSEGNFLPVRPYGSSLAFDWRARVEGDSWAMMDGEDVDALLAFDENAENRNENIN